ncbi:flagella basal body P-ring formation protein FlgA [Limimonas halophila]|uniref:Flagella basal body P-ring formation protein FlgA n=1 Tax=Limimonas halophila TaxID=1082479 RepID=A0A1G7Q877_9PROT|nr:flagellar basal body P-ring formation chaperone FlgA [Limimonas halophila]SDF93800.1 flagella basal body P-ring formation protein FlgA [Limimonas halophila]
MRARTLILAAVTGGLVAASATADERVMVNRDVTVEGETVRLGDIFAGVGNKASAPVTQAPEPGQRVRLDTDWLKKVARSYGLDWSPTSPNLDVEVTRATQTLGADVIRNAIADALDRQGVRGTYDLDLNNDRIGLELAASSPATVTVTKLSYRRERGRFTASVQAPASGEPEASATVSGSVVRQRTVPVPTQRISRGDRIRARDLRMVQRRQDRLPRGAVVSKDNLVGLEASRSLAQDRVVRRNDVQKPVLVTRNSAVTIELKTDSMRLTATGRALEDGARGEMVRVVNTMSKKTVSGQVVGAETVAVRP